MRIITVDPISTSSNLCVCRKKRGQYWSCYSSNLKIKEFRPPRWKGDTRKFFTYRDATRSEIQAVVDAFNRMHGHASPFAFALGDKSKECFGLFFL